MSKFDRLRPFLVIYRVLRLFSRFLGCSSSTDFDRVRICPFPLCEQTPHRPDRTVKTSNESPRTSPLRLMAAGAVRFQ